MLVAKAKLPHRQVALDRHNLFTFCSGKKRLLLYAGVTFATGSRLSEGFFFSFPKIVEELLTVKRQLATQTAAQEPTQYFRTVRSFSEKNMELHGAPQSLVTWLGRRRMKK